MCSFILKRAVPVPKLTGFDRYLFVGPHPDDIEVACGGTVARLTAMGKSVTFLIVTNGCVGSLDPTVSAQRLVEIRREEAIASARLLGVSDVRFLPYGDGGDYNLSDVTKDIAAAILDVKPQIVFCPDHTVASECHPDHLAVGKAVTDAVFYASWNRLTERLGLEGAVKDVSIAYYFARKVNSYVGVRKTHKLHMQAIACHKSQFGPDDIKAFRTYFALRELRFGARSGKGRAEGYRTLAPMHQHCMPEF